MNQFSLQFDIWRWHKRLCSTNGVYSYVMFLLGILISQSRDFETWVGPGIPASLESRWKVPNYDGVPWLSHFMTVDVFYGGGWSCVIIVWQLMSSFTNNPLVNACAMCCAASS